MDLLNNTFIRLISIKHSQKKFFCEQENEVGRTDNNFHRLFHIHAILTQMFGYSSAFARFF